MEIYEYITLDENGKPIFIRKTRHEILNVYYDHWYQKMRKVHREHLINEDNCIRAWAAVNWAYKIGE